MEKPYRILYPMGVVLVSSSHAGRDNVMAACWAFPLSADPFLIGVSVSRKRFSHQLMEGSREFVINIPGQDMAEAVRICGENSGRDTDKFALAKLTKEKSRTAVAPSIKEALASIECKIVKSLDTGDHVLFIGEMLNMKKRKEGKKLVQSEEGLIISS